jgi:hypothetical protein
MQLIKALDRKATMHDASCIKLFVYIYKLLVTSIDQILSSNHRYTSNVKLPTFMS